MTHAARPCLVDRMPRFARGLARNDKAKRGERLELPTTSRHKAAMAVRLHSARLIGAALLAMAPCDFAAAEPIPVPPPRPAPAAAGAPEEGPKAEVVQPSACRLRLTAELAVAPSLPPIEGPGECGGPDLVRPERVVQPEKSRVA